jgi:eukaryotic-like serine/threonine-protein kinase
MSRIPQNGTSQSTPSIEGESVLENLIEECTNRIQAGEAIDVDELARHHPEHAERLRRLLPSLAMMAEVGRTSIRPLHAGSRTTVDLEPPQSGPFELGDFHVHQVIGRGGMGIVYEAIQVSLNRRVALKILPFAAALDPHHLRRFQTEAQAAAQLHHTNIVPVFAVGCERGVHFYAMQFIEGRTVAALIHDRREMSEAVSGPCRPASDREYVRSVARLGIQAAEALDHAHRQGIIHRDIKPANLLVDLHGNLWITDFGLARFLNETGLTLTGDLIGTLRYMSPEQALGKRLILDHRTDIYSIGSTLYELLTLHPVVDGRDRQEVLRRIAQDEPTPPRRIDRAIPRDLETIFLKSLAREPEDRYATAQELADDLRRFLEHRPIKARRQNLLERAFKWARRHQMATAAMVVALAVCIVALGAVVGVQLRANRDLRNAFLATQEALSQSEQSRKEAAAVSAFLVEALRSPDPRQDGQNVKVADVLDRASEQLEKGFSGSPVTRGVLLQALGDTYSGLGLFHRAEELHTRAWIIREQSLGPYHPDTLSSRDHLGNDYWRAGRHAEAAAFLEATLKLSEAVLGHEHPGTLNTRHNLGVAYRRDRRTSEAIATLEATIRLRESVLGFDHPDTLLSRNSLAVSYKDAGRLAETIALEESTLGLQEKRLGPDHLDTLQSRHNIGVAYRDAGRFSDAIALFEATLEIRLAKVGPDNPDTLFSRLDLGIAYWCVGRYSEAIEMLEEASKHREARQGPGHAETLQCRTKLALAYRDAWRIPEALEQYERMFQTWNSRIAPHDPDSLWAPEGLAEIHESLGDWAEAERLFRIHVADGRKIGRSDDPLLAGDLAALGLNLLKQSRWSEAEVCSHESMMVFEKLASDYWIRFQAMSQVGGAMIGQGRYIKAEPLVLRGYEGLEARRNRIPVPYRSRLTEAADRVVRLYESWGKHDQAAAWKVRLGIPDLPADVFALP